MICAKQKRKRCAVWPEPREAKIAAADRATVAEAEGSFAATLEASGDRAWSCSRSRRVLRSSAWAAEMPSRPFACVLAVSLASAAPCPDWRTERRSPVLPQIDFATDSLLERREFEFSVPHAMMSL